MNKEITLTVEELEKEIKQAFIHGQGNAEMMEAGLERDETEDYVNSSMRTLSKDLKIQSDEIIKLKAELKRVTKKASILEQDVFKLISKYED